MFSPKKHTYPCIIKHLKCYLKRLLNQKHDSKITEGLGNYVQVPVLILQRRNFKTQRCGDDSVRKMVQSGIIHTQNHQIKEHSSEGNPQ